LPKGKGEKEATTTQHDSQTPDVRRFTDINTKRLGDNVPADAKIRTESVIKMHRVAVLVPDPPKYQPF